MALNGWGSKKKREKPNILITGTPGTGKTTTATALAESIQLRHINIGDLVKEKNLHDGWDDQFDCYLINEDLVSFYIELLIYYVKLYYSNLELGCRVFARILTFGSFILREI